jgi:hypothetical protein
MERKTRETNIPAMARGAPARVSGVRARRQYGDRRQRLAFYELQKGTAAC